MNLFDISKHALETPGLRMYDVEDGRVVVRPVEPLVAFRLMRRPNAFTFLDAKGRRKLGAGFRLKSVALETNTNPDVKLPNGTELKWIQVAEEGDFKGHPAGQFVLDKSAFDQIVANFKAHPSYVKDPVAARVIPFDFSHASEQPPTEGVLPQMGAPAQAWGHDLETRQDLSSNKWQLWCLTEYLEPMKSYVLQGKYQWTSVTIWPNTPDPVTKRNLGWYLSSIAFTNDPFIQGMIPIAAERPRTKQGKTLDTDYMEDTLEWVVCELRWIFKLEELAPVDEIVSALAKLRSYCSNPAAEPVGVDSDDIVCKLRELFNLPTLSNVDDVFREADRLLVTLAEQASSATLATKGQNMDKNERAVIALAARLKVNIPSDCNDPGRLLLEAVDDSVDKAGKGGADVTAKLGALLTALGVQDPDAGVAKVAGLMKTAADLEAAMPELAQLREMTAKAEDESATDDVTNAVAYHRMPESAKPALLHMRKTNKTAFLAQYPRPSAQQIALSKSLVTLPMGGPAPTGVTPAANGGPTPAGTPGGITLAMIEGFDGCNITAKTIACLRETVPGCKSMSWEAINERAAIVLSTARSQAANGRGQHASRI